MAGIVAHVVEPWRIFELLAAHLVATIAAMKLAINDRGSDLTWADALPELLGASAIGKKTKFDLGLEPYRLTRVHGKCPDLLEEDPERFMGNGALSPADKSNSADVFHLQRMMSGEGHVVIQSQPKLWVISQVTMSTCRDEVGKSTKRMQSILTIYAATIGSQLIKAMANDVLVLRSWDKSTQAMFVFSVDNVLLWRPVVLEAANAGPDATYENKKAESNAEKTEFEQFQGSRQWYEYPGRNRSNKRPARGSAFVKVRVGLEVVIPHPKVTKKLIGNDRFNTLVAAHRDQFGPSSSSAVINALDDVLKCSNSGQRKAVASDQPQNRSGPMIDGGHVHRNKVRVHFCNKESLKSIVLDVKVGNFSLFDAIYNNSHARKAGIRIWSSKILAKLKSVELVPVCRVWVAARVVFDYEVSELKITTTEELCERLQVDTGNAKIFVELYALPAQPLSSEY